MRAIRSKNTKPEILLRKALHARGFRFRLNVKTLPGTPDIVMPKFKVVIFANGCFWHGHNCHLFKVPTTRTEFWLSKIAGNVNRDKIFQKNLIEAGWRIAVVWECALKGRYKPQFDTLIDELVGWIEAAQSTPEIEFRSKNNI